MIPISDLIQSTLAIVPPNPIGSVPNLRLTFTLKGAPTGQIDSAGNPIALVTTIVVSAIVREDGIRDREIQQAGGNQSEFYLKGRCLSPKILPPALRLNQEAQAIYTDPASGAEIRGRFRVSFTNPHWDGAIAAKLGSKLTGIFIVTT